MPKEATLKFEYVIRRKDQGEIVPSDVSAAVKGIIQGLQNDCQDLIFEDGIVTLEPDSL